MDITTDTMLKDLRDFNPAALPDSAQAQTIAATIAALLEQVHDPSALRSAARLYGLLLAGDYAQAYILATNIGQVPHG